MLLDKTIKSLNEGLKNKSFSSRDIIEECYENISKYAELTNAFITIVDKEEALKSAYESDKRHNKKSIIDGLPYVMKDAYMAKGIKTTCASNVLSDYVAQYDATVYKKLKNAGAILVGKMNMDAWGHGGTSENTDFGAVRNPWDTNRSAGGSSGGPSAAIASRMAVFAIAEDTGGSNRNPAVWCNLTGLKVTYGRVSRYGCIAYASSFDTVCPLCKCAEDNAHILEIIAGEDRYDGTTSNVAVNKYSKYLNNSVKNLVLGYPKEFFNKNLDPEINNKIKDSLNIFCEIGLKVKEISMPTLVNGVLAYHLIAPSETSSNLARYDGLRYGDIRDKFTEETKRRIMIGTYALSSGFYDEYYEKAQKVRTLIIEEYNRALKKCDVLLMPVTPSNPTKIGELISDPLKNLLFDVYTATQNLAGVPSLAMPCGFTKSKLPIGMQITANLFEEALLLNLGNKYQQSTSWHKDKPVLLDK